MIFRRIVFTIILLFLASCAEVPLPGITPTPEDTSTPTSTALPTMEPSPTPSGPSTLRIWLPPQLDPASGTAAGDILQARLDEFIDRRPDTRLEVRVKTLDGPGGILDTLSTASAAAPLALPDLVALPRPSLETAALKGLLHPFDDLTQAMDDPDWYDYARKMARLQDSTFGLPFAGDALFMVYRTSTISEPPREFSTTLATMGPLAFPAADPQALVTLTLYQSAGGAILDEQGRPFLDTGPLNEVLTLYNDGATNELLPLWLTQLETDEEVWEAYLENRAEMALSWTSTHLQKNAPETLGSHIPTLDGSPYTLANGWLWALAGANPEHQSLSAELAEFLTDNTFLAEWNSALGYLPPRPSSLPDWRPISMRPLVNQISVTADLIPPTDVLNSLGPALQSATVEVLKLQIDPLTAAEMAVDSLSEP
jgi:multiple sugar transport system substrate-binding protein